MLFNKALAILSTISLTAALPTNATSPNSTLSIASEAGINSDQHTPHHHIHCHHYLSPKCRARGLQPHTGIDRIWDAIAEFALFYSPSSSGAAHPPTPHRS
ncbi:hypothetical protein DM02DRAFT_727880 [Periconia macrospinosa]|uniref:Uncharacterized protein n=1 Tax=Periconia macrospinosa TaxID=97972 RepID=A0A2V1DVY5_9PLEO|nr:hypothetical protein DM02DRAFT_727880 [Periconia macrospinosa]